MIMRARNGGSMAERQLPASRNMPPQRHVVWRAFDGLTWGRVGIVLAFCAVWAAAATIHDVVAAWRDGVVLSWARFQLFEAFACMAVIAAVMGLPIVAVRNLGPASGWRRAAALAATIAAMAPFGAAVRLGYLVWADDGPLTPEQWPGLLGMFWLRYVLQAQIEPHFLFNTPANVRRLYQTDAAAGRAMLDNLLRYLEVALPRMRDERSTVGGELALVEAYLNVQRIRMGRRLAFRLDVPQQLHALELPPMMLLT